MSDVLTQEEINALLTSGSGGSNSPSEVDPMSELTSEAVFNNSSGVDTIFSKEEIYQLSEVAKLSLGATSSVLKVLLNKEVEIRLAQVRAVDFDNLVSDGNSREFVLAKIDYVEGFDGNSYLMLEKGLSALIGDLMMGGTGIEPEFQEMHISAVGEMLNQMMGKTTTSLSEIFKKRVDISPPEVILVNFDDGPSRKLGFSETSQFLRIDYKLKIGDIVEAEIVQLLPAEFARLMASELTKPKEQKKAIYPPPPSSTVGAPVSSQMPGQSDMNVQSHMPSMMGVPGQMPSMMHGSPAEFGMLQMPVGGGLHSNIDLLLDVPLQITVELGRTRMLIKDILELGIGSVVELNKLAGESVEVFVNNKLIAKGEVVVIDESFAVRITSIINPQDRLEAL